ncbi:MAG: class I SAM-dependent DNA methyltransferase, partial [Corynebacterium sp.]|nr:class I SAM-dependent DNA methyltransferase [Corynebacterium sp.]
MAVYDAIINNDSFVSDFFLTSDEKKGTFTAAVVKRVKAWKAEKNELLGLDEAPALKRLSGVRARLLDAYALFGDEDQNPNTVYNLIHEFIGLKDAAFTQQNLATEGDNMRDFTGRFFRDEENHVIIFDAQPAATSEDIVASKLRHELVVDEKPVDYTVSKTLSTIFSLEAPPEYAVVVAGHWLLFTSREAWPLGRFLAVNLLWVLEQNETKVAGLDDLTTCIFAIENLKKNPDSTCWWDDVLESAKEHTAKVSGTLRHAVRDCVQIIGNDVLERRRNQQLTNNDETAQLLTRQSLRYMYRILFILFAEASPELGVLPVNTDEYDFGYGLTRLRNQFLETPSSYTVENGTYLYDSLNVLFRNVNGGTNLGEEFASHYMSFAGVEADIFLPESTSLITEVKLSNKALAQILNKLLLTEKQKGKDRGFISYASLGVTELGQVYEGLMSYKGFIAEEELYEIAPGGDSSKGSWVLPVRVVRENENKYSQKDLVTTVNEETGISSPVVYPVGSFVYRQSSYDRERSASFYTPEVLTKFTVDQVLEVLDEQNAITKAEDYLHLTVCEPAMGSGAFAVQAVRRLAERYLDMREQELKEELGEDYEPLNPEDRPAEIQKIKAYIALHNVYGVDLNETAVELGQIALWLDSMTPGLRAPWFGLHLRAGNALIGANRTTFNAKDLAKDAQKKKPAYPWLDTIAAKYDTNEPFNGKIYSFLLPSPTWGAVTSKVETHVKKRFGDEIKAIKTWIKKVSKPNLLAAVPFEVKRPYQFKTDTNSTKYEVGNITRLEFLEQLSMRINQLWEFATTRLELAEKQIQRDLHIWGFDPNLQDREVTRQQIEDSLENPTSALQRLKLVMDIWCALKFWPIIVPTDSSGNAIVPPSYDEILEAIDAIIGDYVPAASTKNGQISFGEITTWESLEAAESENFALAFTNIDENIDNVIAAFPWLQTVQQISQEQNFFHWELMFSQVFATGGFDLIVGNPPWVRPTADENAALAEFDPWWEIINKPTQSARNSEREIALMDVKFLPSYVSAMSIPIVVSKILNDKLLYPELLNQQPDLYRAFMVQSWRILNQQTGSIGLIHPESHFTEVKAAPLRKAAYYRLHRHFHFNNAKQLFDIDSKITFGVHIYQNSSQIIEFINMANLYHPETASQTLKYMPQGNFIPSLRDEEGKLDLRPHADRCQIINDKMLSLWNKMVESEGVDIDKSRMVYTTNTTATRILAKLAQFP